MKEVNVSEFKAVCLRLLEEVRQTGESIQILKNGQPLAIVNPPASKRKDAFGALKSTVRKSPDDLISPLEATDWEALSE